tara:strand:- start:144 stop:731 length:588 start_codon:yes stop_codon:yes gene_type:complete
MAPELWPIWIILYLIGSIPFAIISSKLMNLPDPRTYGSNNPGATNVLRTGNKTAAFLTLLGDSLKGFIPVMLIMSIVESDVSMIINITVSYFSSFFILLGHMFPIFLKFKGGKGVATSFGILFALDPRIGFSLLAIWLLVFIIFRVSATSALAAFFLLPFFVAFFLGDNFITILAVTNSLFIYLKHINGFAQLKN